jgi:threonyl-tRNA synthetase
MNKEQSAELTKVRHSLAHLLAAAVLELYPNTKPTIGPAIDNGFYYDFEFASPINDAELPKIEKKMREILKTWKQFTSVSITQEEALGKFSENPYKQELINEITAKGEGLTLYTSGKFVDLCRGGHVDDTGGIKPDAFKLSHVAGAYWRGDEKNKMLTRIYGLAFESKDALEKYELMIEEAKKRDHKKLGPELELFMFHPTSPGMPYWLPKGVTFYNELVKFWREEHQKRGYQEIISPLLNKKELYITSGHYDHYWSDMFVANMGEGEEYGIKAMNCPNAHVVYGHKTRSYRDLPLRLSDTDTLHRFERSGTLNGLLRVREFRQDDAHIYVTEEQIESEYKEVFEIVKRFYSIFGLQYSFRLGTRDPKNFMGDIETWNRAEATLKKILEDSNVDFFILEGDGAFYGPKVDILMKDALGREWQMGTVQLDFQQPRRFNLEYAAQDGTKKTPIAIHRVIYGSLERFIGILVEHVAGAFPTWLSPVQVIVIPISDKHMDYAKSVFEKLKESNIRAELDSTNESLGKKIRNAKTSKTPYSLVIGDKEVESGTVTVESRDRGQIGAQKLEEFLASIQAEIKDKK